MKLIKTIFWALVALVVAATLFLIFSNKTSAATNVNSSPTSSVAWDPIDGWWNFYGSQTVIVSGTKLSGYATSSIGDMSLDCSTTRNGSICNASNYGVCNGKSATHNTDGTCSGADASGNLSGWAWNDNIGWISFCGGLNTSACPGSINYDVAVDSSGNFQGWAWNDKVGWISFNCDNPGSGNCSVNPYLVNTAWESTSTVGYLTSYIIDAGSTSTLQSIIWQGDPGLSGTSLGFEVAASNSTSGPWNYIGPSGTSSGWYNAPCSQGLTGGQLTSGIPSPGVPICVNPSLFNNFRYFRYKIMLQSNLLQDSSPKVTNVILNFSK